jgi:hypothetical protein
MTRPLALIEGDLALPDARLLRGLPPPFGSRRQSARTAPQREMQRAAQRAAEHDAQHAAQHVTAIAAQQTIRRAIRHKAPVRQRPLPPGTLFRFFYKVRQPRDYSTHFNAQLAEARYYLDAGKTPARSSRKDYMLGAAIFAVTGIALAWLLTISVMRDAEKGGSAVMAQSGAAGSEKQDPPSQLAIKIARTVVKDAATARNPVHRAARPVESVTGLQAQNSSTSMTSQQAVRSVKTSPTHQAARAAERPTSSRHRESYKTAGALTPDVATRHSARVGESARRGQSMLRLSEAQIDDRLAMSRAVAPSAQPAASMQPEWTARALSTKAAPEQAALLNWAAQQRQASVAATSTTTTSTTTTRASVPATPADATWNAALTHRRITDNPHAFDTDAARP